MRLLYVVLAALLVANVAQADTLTGTYSGFVNPTPRPGHAFFDQGNYFGFGANANLGGLPISGTFTYNPDNAITQVCEPGACSVCTQVCDDPSGVCRNYFGVMSRITVTIGTHTITATGAQQDSEVTLASGEGSTFDILAADSLADIAVGVHTFGDQFSINPLDPNSPNFSVTNPDVYFGQFDFSNPALDSAFNFSVTQFEVGPVSAVPGPIAGAGLPGLI